MLISSMRLHGCGSMQHPDPFSLSGYCTLLAWSSLWKVSRGIGGQSCLQWRYMLISSMRLHGCGSMQHPDPFSLSGCYFMAIWFSWMQSCGLLCGDRTHGESHSKHGYFLIGLMTIEKSSHVLLASFCSSLLSRESKTAPLPLVGKIPCCLYGSPGHWSRFGTIRDQPPLPLRFPKLWHWGLYWFICGLCIGS